MMQQSSSRGSAMLLVREDLRGSMGHRTPDKKPYLAGVMHGTCNRFPLNSPYRSGGGQARNAVLWQQQIPPRPLGLRAGFFSESQTLNCFLAVGLYAHQGEVATLVPWFDRHDALILLGPYF